MREGPDGCELEEMLPALGPEMLPVLGPARPTLLVRLGPPAPAAGTDSVFMAMDGRRLASPCCWAACSFCSSDISVVVVVVEVVVVVVVVVVVERGLF